MRDFTLFDMGGPHSLEYLQRTNVFITKVTHAEDILFLFSTQDLNSGTNSFLVGKNCNDPDFSGGPVWPLLKIKV